jgi:hypothetical protein
MIHQTSLIQIERLQMSEILWFSQIQRLVSPERLTSQLKGDVDVGDRAHAYQTAYCTAHTAISGVKFLRSFSTTPQTTERRSNCEMERQNEMRRNWSNVRAFVSADLISIRSTSGGTI